MPTGTKGPVDALTLGVVWNRLLSIVDEQSVRIIRAGMTTSLSEGGDIACSLFDSKGRLIAQSTGTPGMSHSLPSAIRAFMERYPPEMLVPGDALITNDPWLCAGHLNDIVIATPVFFRGRFTGFNATACHAADIGGHGFSADSDDIYHEGLQIPRLKLFKGGRLNEDLVALIRQNVRISDRVVADVLTQASSAEAASQELAATLDEFGLSSFDDLAEQIVRSSRVAMQTALRQLPDGTFRDEMWADGLDEPIRLAVAATVRNGTITLDFAGTSEAVSRGINSVANYSRAYAVHAVKSSLLPEVPGNEGVFEPIRTIFPEGSIFNARRPSPVSARHLVGHFAAFVVYGALRHAVPDRIIADSGGPCGGTLQLSGVHTNGERFSVLAFNSGGFGARPGKDGLETTHFPANAASTAVEILEGVAPIYIECKEFRQDSGGPGRFRGGLGQRLVFRIESPEPMRCTFMFERVRHPPRGFGGGRDGMPSACRVNGVPIPNEKQTYFLKPGDVAEMLLAGGGGFYPPEQRDVALVARDVAQEKVSVGAAREMYRVATSQRGDVDAPLTQRLREEPDPP